MYEFVDCRIVADVYIAGGKKHFVGGENIAAVRTELIYKAFCVIDALGL